MVLVQCVNAYMAVQAVAEQEMDYQTAYALVSLKRKLYPHVSFYQQEETKLMEQYAARDDKGKIIWKNSGRFVLQDPEKGEEYSRKRAELGMVEVQEVFEPVRVPEPQRIRPSILEALDGFLVFGEEDAR